jgi:hypothetical protein
MKHLTTLFAIIIAWTGGTTAPAQAASRTWVSGTGLDGNPCSRSAPCATFAHALTVTDAFGEINCLDPGSFGTLSITQSVTISCEAGTAGILASANNGILVNVAASDVVYLRGLDINGLGPQPFSFGGIVFIGAGTLHVEKCLIHAFNQTSGPGSRDGIAFIPNGTASLSVADTVIADSGLGGSFGGGIVVQPSNSANVTVSLERVQMTSNGLGLDADASNAGAVSVSIADSVFSGNLHSGVIAETTGGQIHMMIDHAKSSNNGSSGSVPTGPMRS